MLNYLAYRKPVTGAEIKNAAASTFLKPLQPKNVCLNKIANVYVITDAGPIWCIVISTKDRQCITFPVCSIKDQWDQMRLWLMKFSNLCLNALDAVGQKKIVRSNYIKHSDISDDFLIFSPLEVVTKSIMIKLLYLSLIWCFEWPYYEFIYWIKIIKQKIQLDKQQHVEFQNN